MCEGASVFIWKSEDCFRGSVLSFPELPSGSGFHMSTSPLNSFISLVPWVYPLHLASLQCPFSFEGSYFLFLIYFPENKYTWCLLIFAFSHTQKVSCFDQLMSAEKSCVVSTQRLSSFLCIIAQATKVWIYQTEVFLSSVGGNFWPITSVLQWPNLNLQLLVTLACLFVGKIPKSGFQGGRVNVSIFRGKKKPTYINEHVYEL